jgi:hypothetical protein
MQSLLGQLDDDVLPNDHPSGKNGFFRFETDTLSHAIDAMGRARILDRRDLACWSTGSASGCVPSLYELNADGPEAGQPESARLSCEMRPLAMNSVKQQPRGQAQ